MRKILFVVFAWAMWANLAFGEFGELQWHKCENIFDNDRQGESQLRWRKCGESESSPSLAEGDKGGGYKNAKDSKNAEFNGNDSTHPLAPSAREGESMALSSAREGKCVDCHDSAFAESRNDKISESVESHNPKVPESTLNRNAFFAGIELGYMRFDYAESGKIGANALLNPSSNGAFNAGIIAGYRYFFNDSVGIRGYANLNYNYGKANGFGELKMLNVGINADFLLNFYASQSVDFGAIVGLGFGGDIFDGDGLKRVRESIGEHSANLSSPNVSVNLGIQIVAINKIGVEFVAKIPLLAHYFLNAGDGKLNSITRQLSQNYSLNARVVWQF